MEKLILSNRLKELRQSLNLTQKELAKNLNITPAALSKYESGTGYPSMPIIYDIATKYDVSVDWLLGVSDNTSIKKLKTYSDVLQNIFQLAISLDDFYFDFDGYTIDEDEDFKTETYINIWDDILASMLDRFNKTYILYKDKTIGIDVLQAVVDSLKKEYKNIKTR